MSQSGDPREAMAVLRKLSPDKVQFASDFKSLSFRTRRAQARLLLRHFEMHGRRTGEIEPTRVNRRLHVEHILPLNPEGTESRAHQKIVHLIGNMTLLSSKMNTRIKNGLFAKKKSEYGKSEIAITKALAAHAGIWKAPAILKRQADLAEAAARIWPVELASDDEILRASSPRSARPGVKARSLFDQASAPGGI
jgi:hypothetical protein